MSGRGRLLDCVEGHWYGAPGVLALGLWPLEACYRSLVAVRRPWQRLLAARQDRVPVIVVGNLAVGGTGKTPLVLALAQQLQATGMRAGIVSRGHGGSAARMPRRVLAHDAAAEVGDEALLLALRSEAPVWIGRDRAATVRALLAASEVDVVISDDGLQHYRMARAMEICVLDGTRWLGNRRCLPAGPLREPRARLGSVDFVLANGEPVHDHPRVDGVMHIESLEWRRVSDDAALPLSCFGAGERVHALAGIGNPRRFFASLVALGLQPVEHAYPDHHRWQAHELQFGDGLRVVMTEKDAVKCRAFAPPDSLALRVGARLPATLLPAVRARMAEFATRGPA
jgi:tetraacyldisaccharide 4'-kinase